MNSQCIEKDDSFPLKGACMCFDGTDVEQLEILQDKLIFLDEENFEDTKIWILNSIFCLSDEGIHDLIYTFYLLISTRSCYMKNIIFSRMITSLYELRVFNRFLNQIPRQAEELLVLTSNLSVENFVHELISKSVINKSSYENIKNRKRNVEKIPEAFRKNKHFIYSNFDDRDLRENKIALAIKNDDLNRLKNLLTNLTNNKTKIEFELKDRRIQMQFTMIGFAAFNESVKCFKFLLINGAKITDEVIENAFIGGNLEIIQTINQHDNNLSSGLINAYEHFHNDLFDWLIDYKNVKMPFFMFHTENVHVLRHMTYIKYKLDSSSLNNNYIILTKYFINCLDDISLNGTALHYASINGNVGLVKYILMNYNTKIYEHQNSIISAFNVNRIEVIEYFLKSNLKIIERIQSSLFRISIENGSMQSIQLLIKNNYFNVGKLAWKAAMKLDNKNLIYLLIQQKKIWENFDFGLLKYCSRYGAINCYKFFLNLNGVFDHCVKAIGGYKRCDSHIIDALINKIHSTKDFNQLQSKNWENIEQLETWLLVTCLNLLLNDEESTNAAKYLLAHKKICLKNELYEILLLECISTNRLNHMTKWLYINFREYFKQNEDELMNIFIEYGKMKLLYSCDKSIFPKLLNHEKVEVLLNELKNGILDSLVEFRCFLPEIINITVNGESLVSVGIRNKEIMKILINVINLDFHHDSEIPLEHIAYGTESFDIVMKHPKAALNCVGHYHKYKIPLILRIAMADDIEHFQMFLRKPHILVNCFVYIKRDSGEYKCFALIHYLIWNHKINMLKLLLNFPTIDVNIFSADSITPMALAHKVSNDEIIKMLATDSRMKNMIDDTKMDKCDVLDRINQFNYIFF